MPVSTQEMSCEKRAGNIDDLSKDCGNSIADAMELSNVYTNPSISSTIIDNSHASPGTPPWMVTW